MIIVRNGHAERTVPWNHEEWLRPLSNHGQVQASALVHALAHDDVGDLWSSASQRCRATLGPLAAQRGLKVTEHRLLDRDASSDKLLASILAHAGEPWVLCTHGAVITGLLRLGHATGLLVAPAIVTERGAAWRVAGLHTGSITMEYVPSPLSVLSPLKKAHTEHDSQTPGVTRPRMRG